MTGFPGPPPFLHRFIGLKPQVTSLLPDLPEQTSSPLGLQASLHDSSFSAATSVVLCSLSHPHAHACAQTHAHTLHLGLHAFARAVADLRFSHPPVTLSTFSSVFFQSHLCRCTSKSHNAIHLFKASGSMVGSVFTVMCHVSQLIFITSKRNLYRLAVASQSPAPTLLSDLGNQPSPFFLCIFPFSGHFIGMEMYMWPLGTVLFHLACFQGSPMI